MADESAGGAASAGDRDGGAYARAFDDVLRAGERTNWAGYDPYDALRSPLARAFSFGAKWPRVAWIQLVKRSPLNLRPLLLVSKSVNAKTLGLVARALVFDGRTRGVDRRAHVERLLASLDRIRSPGATGSAWGYPFDWQSRAFFVPANTGSIVASTFVAHAYLEAYDEWGDAAWLARARETCDFVLTDLHRTPGRGDAYCFSYTPGDRTRVHNANLLGSALLARVARATGEVELREAAIRSARYAVDAQSPDGSWAYGEAENQRWIDSFHTGYNLVSLVEVAEAFGLTEWDDAIRRGYAFYEKNFFLPDGAPKYYHDNLYPIDIHSAAQALVTFAVFAGRGEPGALAAGERVARWTLANMRDARSGFIFQRTARYTHRTSFVRWSQAWMLYALARHLAALESSGGPPMAADGTERSVTNR